MIMSLSDVSTVLITGGNGCLGRFLVDLLQEHFDKTTTEAKKIIRILDNSTDGQDYFRERYGRSDHAFEIEFITGDVRKASTVRRAVKDVQCVFHLAGIVDISMFPGENLMWAVNCRGTQDLLEACYEANVSYVIFTSSVNAVLGVNPLVDAAENDCPKPSEWLYKGYGETKWFAEQMVKDADNLPLANGQRLRTISLRPTVFYGENDRINVPVLLKLAQNGGNNLLQFGNNDTAKIQQTYVGNVAWAHVQALKSLIEHPDDCAGQAYFITDNTPMLSPFQFARPFLEDRRMRLSRFSVPISVIYFVVLTFIFVFNLLLRVWPDWDAVKRTKLPSKAQIMFLRMGVSFDRSKAERVLNYSPRYTYEESVDASRKYYAQMEL
ncbi:3 beta-hydroxysteroid dehydrogenase/Delta 5--_4-isomerase type 1-like [Paramacrobiotus metropolitanus]|uniref:3 beta-hydroxysteroid dehydrogenase/Delta 5-->4-isomerase type 1-like n=1 Tax=Paramacrobiotus metropolitanus TaxID=2943436 RepID=UPI002446574A|nr:3 beta-hydroxysteroid dehydrogenase/Delta 5-->4-isomerase type 1-like [Paramacrobiotus metropolitanus]XP_055337508.1 3 beta-hydroxysteroid dehydrogenase/Delta 5-->4-isomerase type 1-like [Paramacrobiotus metropolitanus]XP_055337509.1 3 beta-hydroxysteroid dehydrogenase/Delta 5-->4-isomerase type 1-like [Paramacrobiotus metropolitanus]